MRVPNRRARQARIRPGQAVAALLTLALLVSACGGDDEPVMTIEEQLAEIEGRTLGPAEVEELLSVGETLCQMSDPVLDAIWFKLDDDQLDFQDLVFGRLCPERSVFYAGKTGRYVTEEATESGVVTSTSRPTSTVATTTSTTTGSGATTSVSAGPDSTEGQGDGTATSTVTSNAETSSTASASTASTSTLSTTTAQSTGTETTPFSPSTTSVGEGG